MHIVLIIRPLVTFILVLFTSAFATAEVTETREISDFSRVQVDGNIQLEIINSEEFEVVVSAEDDDIENISTDLRGGQSRTLVLELEGSGARNGDYRALISMPSLNGLELNGAGEAELGDFDVNELEIRISGSADVIAGNFTATDVALGIAGSGEVIVSSLESDSLEVDIAGSGEVTLNSLQVEDMEISLAGSGDIIASGNVVNLEASIFGSGDVGGDELFVQNVEGTIAGSGDIDIPNAENIEIEVIGSNVDFGELRELGMDLGTFFGGEYFDEEIIEAAGSSGRNLRQKHDGEWLTGLIAVTLSLGMPIIIVALGVTYSYRKKRLEHDTLRKFADSGQPIPEHVLESFSSGHTPQKTSLQSGLTLIAVGVGLAIFFMAIGVQAIAAAGAIPALVGVAKLIAWKLEGGKDS